MCHSSASPLLTQIPTGILVILGWYAVHYFAKQRDKCKEARERLDQLVSALHSIEERAIQFHQSNTFKGDLARALRFDIQRVIARLRRYPFNSWSIDPVKLLELRKTVTYKNFDESKFSCQPASSIILSNIANAVDEIEDMLEAEYEQLYL
jgi:hypothetical protein